MNKAYKKIEFEIGGNIESAVRKLLSYKEKSELVCGDFNGVILYSDTVTIDGAYKDILGKTKIEYEKEEQDHKESIPSLSNEWIEKGKEILTEDKWEYWSKIVPIRLNDLYHGMELGACLDIIEILNNNGTLDEAKKKIDDQCHSGTSFGLVCAMVREFCSRGNEFVEYVR